MIMRVITVLLPKGKREELLPESLRLSGNNKVTLPEGNETVITQSRSAVTILSFMQTFNKKAVRLMAQLINKRWLKSQ